MFKRYNDELEMLKHIIEIRYETRGESTTNYIKQLACKLLMSCKLNVCHVFKFAIFVHLLSESFFCATCYIFVYLVYQKIKPILKFLMYSSAVCHLSIYQYLKLSFHIWQSEWYSTSGLDNSFNHFNW